MRNRYLNWIFVSIVRAITLAVITIIICVIVWRLYRVKRCFFEKNIIKLNTIAIRTKTISLLRLNEILYVLFNTINLSHCESSLCDAYASHLTTGQSLVITLSVFWKSFQFGLLSFEHRYILLYNALTSIGLIYKISTFLR